MKKVSYWFGTAGLAPAALGILIPATAAMNEHVAKVAVVKPDSLQRGTIREVAAIDGCAGATPTHKTKGNKYIKYWFTVHGDSTCVGTVKGFFASFGAAPNSWMSTYVKYNNGRIYKAPKCFPQPSTKTCFIGIHQSFSDLSEVCEQWKNSLPGVSFGNICRNPIPN